MGITIIVESYLKKKSEKKLIEKVDKFKSYYYMLNNWMTLKQSGKKLEEYFIKEKIGKIAIYGMGELGNRLYEELKGTDIEVLYAIDNTPGYTYSDINVFSIEEPLEQVDAIVVTPIFDFINISQKIEEVLSVRVISLEDVIMKL
jgi:lactate dehydrogenase-like 2-hydroxyacid dehydrogenase